MSEAVFQHVRVGFEVAVRRVWCVVFWPTHGLRGGVFAGLIGLCAW
jgi:hypothetical protein